MRYRAPWFDSWGFEMRAVTVRRVQTAKSPRGFSVATYYGKAGPIASFPVFLAPVDPRGLRDVPTVQECRAICER